MDGADDDARRHVDLSGSTRGIASFTMEPVRAVIFDFDGLLMDTESTSLASWEREWARWGLVLDRASFFVPHGGDMTDQRYAQLASAVGDDFDRPTSHRRRTADREALNAALVLAPGLDDWVEEAGDAGLRTAVASSSTVDWVERHLRQVAALERFEFIVGGDQVEASKPAPDVYRLALSRLGLDGSQAVAVEDTPHGVDAAHAAGLACVAIPNAFVDRSVVAHAELVLDSAAELSLTDALWKAATARSPTHRPAGP